MDDSNDPGLDLPQTGGDAAGESDAYQVLARKYRPSDFSSLIGQEALVRTLTNAIGSGRLAHAFVLTGVRGVGKTTSARIIARALNCIGPDGQGGPTPEPCGICENCVAIAQDRHVDVLEMDAASRTGVDDIREIIDGVRYRPTSARFKVYIIDEVHMLSRNAFNALLKTLEEPPEHVKFIFATTEIRKVPVTVLSRCQRFDLRRVEAETLATHFKGICTKEGAEISEPALHLIARAADGSVRDGLSLLDQAISLAAGPIEEPLVRDMLGLADRSQGFQLLEHVLEGNPAAALMQLRQMYQDGADPGAVIEDLLEITHFLTRIKVVPEAAESPDIPEIERHRGRDLEGRIAMSSLTRAWQMLLKGLQEIQTAPSQIQAAEMVLIRLAHAANLPTPEEALKSLKDDAQAPASNPPATNPPTTTPSATTSAAPAPPASQGAPSSVGGMPTNQSQGQYPSQPQGHPQVRSQGGAATALAEAPVETAAQAPTEAPIGAAAPDRLAPEAEKQAPLTSMQAVVDLAQERREGVLATHLIANIHLVSFDPPRMEFRPTPQAPDNLAGQLAKFLGAETGERWMVSVSNAEGAPTLAAQHEAALAVEKEQLSGHPLVKAVLESFPDATIEEVRRLDIGTPKKGDAS